MVAVENISRIKNSLRVIIGVRGRGLELGVNLGWVLQPGPTCGLLLLVGRPLREHVEALVPVLKSTTGGAQGVGCLALA